MELIGPLGHLSQYPSFKQSFSETLASAIRSFTNLKVLELSGSSIRDFVDLNVLNAIMDTKCLHSLSLNGQIIETPPALAEMSGIEHLSLTRPNRAFLQLLPTWLAINTDSLVQLHLKVCRASLICANFGINVIN